MTMRGVYERLFDTARPKGPYYRGGPVGDPGVPGGIPPTKPGGSPGGPNGEPGMPGGTSMCLWAIERPGRGTNVGRPYRLSTRNLPKKPPMNVTYPIPASTVGRM